MQYWINHHGVQAGPVELEALKDMELTSAAYVWREGLADWVKITQLPELQGYYTTVEGSPMESPEASQATPTTPESEPAMPPRQPAQPYQHPAQPSQPQPQYASEPHDVTEPCPPTNLVWAIIATVMCCLPAGVVAIIYALKVTNKYRERDIEGAKRASETGAWWCIISIILGLLSMPLAWMISGIATMSV